MHSFFCAYKMPYSILAGVEYCFWSYILSPIFFLFQLKAKNMRKFQQRYLYVIISWSALWVFSIFMAQVMKTNCSCKYLVQFVKLIDYKTKTENCEIKKLLFDTAFCLCFFISLVYFCNFLAFSPWFLFFFWFGVLCCFICLILFKKFLKNKWEFYQLRSSHFLLISIFIYLLFILLRFCEDYFKLLFLGSL